MENPSGFGQHFWFYNLKSEISPEVFMPTLQISGNLISVVIPNVSELDTCCKPDSVAFYSHSGNFCNEGLKELEEALFMKTFMFYMTMER